MFCPVSMHVATDNHLRVQAWLVVLKPAAEEVKVLLVETLPRQNQVSKDSQFPKHHIFILEIQSSNMGCPVSKAQSWGGSVAKDHLGLGSSVASLLDCLSQPFHCFPHFTLLR